MRFQLSARSTFVDNRLAVFVAERGQADPASVRFEDGHVHVGGNAIPFEEVVKDAWMARISLSSTGFYKTPKLEWDRIKEVTINIHFSKFVDLTHSLRTLCVCFLGRFFWFCEHEKLRQSRFYLASMLSSTIGYQILTRVDDAALQQRDTIII